MYALTLEDTMPTPVIEPNSDTINWSFSHNLGPILSIEPGDTVIYRTLDATWGRAGNRLFELGLPAFERAPDRDEGHALCGPIAVRGARPGDVLEVRIDRVVPDRWGWTWAGPGYET